MNINKKILASIFICLLYSCADYNTGKSIKEKNKLYYSSSGFALIYEPDLYTQRVVNKKIINNEKLLVMHDVLRINTPIRIVNPVNSKFINTKVYKKADYPKIFNVVISQKVAAVLELDNNNPYIEIIETRNKQINYNTCIIILLLFNIILNIYLYPPINKILHIFNI